MGTIKNRPTRIIEKPFFGYRGKQRLKKYRCDDGNIYTHTELSEIIGIDRRALYNRLDRLGWQHELVLSPPVENGYRFDGSTNNGRNLLPKKKRTNVEQTIALERIPGPGLLEEKYLGR